MSGKRKLVLAALLLAVVGVISVIWLALIARPEPPVPPKLAFAGRESGVTSPVAGFWLTNAPQGAIFLSRVRVQVLVYDRWKTVSDGQPEFSHWLEPGAKQLNLVPFLEAGEHRRLVVAWPEEGPWRVCVDYSTELKGWRGWVLKVRHAWRRRSTALLRGRCWSAFDQHATSQPVAQAVEH